jgi:ABC-type uncharacterized transport system permease subunit
MLAVHCNGLIKVDTEIIDTNLISIVTLIAYLLVASAFYYLYTKGSANQKPIINSLAFVPLALHGYLLHLMIDTELGQNLAYFILVSMIFWVMSLFVVLSNYRRQLSLLLIFLMPLSALAVFLAEYFAGSYFIDASAPKLLIHSLLSIATISMLGVASAQALFVAKLDKNLKTNIAPSSGTPALQDMEKFLYLMLNISFCLLSLTILSAIIFFAGGDEKVSLHKPILSSLSWLVVAAFIYGRFKYGWRAMTAVRFTLSSFVLLLVAYFGTRTMFTSILG